MNPENNIRQIENDFTRLRRAQQQSFDGGGGGGYDGRMEERVKKLEDLVEKTVERVVNIERDVAVVRSNYATKEDIKGIVADFHRELHATTWKIILTFAALCGAVFWMARNIEPPRSAAASASTAPAPTAPAPAQPTAK